ncbi:MAG: hypothetical protein U1F44_02440 [Coriobacteriia bacterium]|nr:hypothetical protein [Coriobacteriia bacterium]
MRITANRLVRGLFVGVLAIAMLAPTVALAAPAGNSTRAAAVADAQVQQLEQRVINALRNRANRFENYAAMLERHQERLLALCVKVEAAGGDCAEVREQLRLSVETMEQARVQEQLAAGMFGDIPDAGDKRGVFSRARVQARASVQMLQRSRNELQTATRALFQVVKDLRAETSE